MSNILKIKEAIQLARRLREQKKSIVLSGGCFDIIHAGHIKFLENAKKLADYLFVLLENDDSVKKRKGNKRPINNQVNRSIVLSAIRFVDRVILLPGDMKDKDYDKLVSEIKPKYLAVTKNDPNIQHKKRQAKYAGSEIIYVTRQILDQSTTKIIKIIENGI